MFILFNKTKWAPHGLGQEAVVQQILLVLKQCKMHVKALKIIGDRRLSLWSKQTRDFTFALKLQPIHSGSFKCGTLCSPK